MNNPIVMNGETAKYDCDQRLWIITNQHGQISGKATDQPITLDLVINADYQQLKITFADRVVSYLDPFNEAMKVVS